MLAIRIGTTKISNSHRGLRFKIEKRDIENGQPNDPCACAAARALRRQCDAKEVFVFRDVTYVLQKNGSAMRYHTSAPLRLETIVFDRLGQFVPGEYDLHPAPEPDAKAKNVPVNASGSPKPRKSSGVRRGIPNVRPTASQKLPGA